MFINRIFLTALLALAGFVMAPSAPADAHPSTPQLTLVGANLEQEQRTEEAIAQFSAAGLDLPPLRIEFHETTDGCRGYAGLYTPAKAEAAPQVDRIQMCNELEVVLLHELAHAWKHHNLTEETKQAFASHWGLERWNDKSDSHLDRGVERAAHTIAFTLNHTGGTPSDNVLRYICGYELLTGRTLPVHQVVECS